MLKVLKYSFFDLIRSRWTIVYALFFMLLTSSLLYLSSDLSNVIISLMNIILVLVPLVATMFGVMYYYSSKEFAELLLAQPIRRTHIFIGQYLGISTSLSASLLLGTGLPFVLYGIFRSPEIWNYAIVLLVGIFLSYIFSALAFLIGLRNENRIKGFGLALLLWLLCAVIYDGIFLLLLAYFSDYPLEKFAVGAALFNPIDLSRILILLKLDISALMGYTGAVFRSWLGTNPGFLISFGILIMWVFLPAWGIRSTAKSKDF